jgi:hypothetical protein
MKSLLERFRALPRAARWLAYFGAFCLGYFLVIQPAIDQVNEFNGRAAAARDELGVEGVAKTQRQAVATQVRAGLSIFGPVAFPGDPAERSQAFNRTINEVLSKHSIRGDRRITRTAPLGTGPIDAVAGFGKRVDRLIMDLQFDASPEQVSAILADLESAPEVAAITRVQLRRETAGEGSAAPGRMLRVSLSAEAWILARKEVPR